MIVMLKIILNYDSNAEKNLIVMLKRVHLKQAHYPERLAHILCLDAPAAFSALWVSF